MFAGGRSFETATGEVVDVLGDSSFRGAWEGGFAIVEPEGLCVGCAIELGEGVGWSVGNLYAAFNDVDTVM